MPITIIPDTGVNNVYVNLNTGLNIILSGVNAQNSVNISGAGVATTPHNNLNGLQGGGSGKYYHISEEQFNNLTTGSVIRPSDTGAFYAASNPSGYITGVNLSAYVTGNVIRPSDTGAFYAASNPSGYITGVNLSAYVTGNVIRPSDTGAFYAASNPSGYVTGVNLSAYVTGNVIRPSDTGAFYAASNPSGYITGVNLSAYVTGNVIRPSDTGAFYATSNPSGYITGVNLSAYVTGNVIRPSDTGAFYAASNPSGYITGVNLSAYVTGNVIRPSDTGAFYAASNPSGYITGVNLSAYLTGNVIRPSDTGAFYAASNPSGYITGVNLSAYVTGNVIRPSDTGAFYAASNPSGYITGVDLSAYVTGEVIRPSDTGAFYPRSNPSGFITGVDLSGYATIPYVTDVSGVLQAQITSGSQISVDTIHLYGKNNQGTTIYKGQPVYINGANGANPLIQLASNTGERTSSKTIGLLSQDLSVNQFGYIITEGLLEGFNTSAGAAGDPMWLGASGNIIYGTGNKPYGNNHLVFLGVVLRSNNNNGKVYVKPQNGFEIEELHKVYAINPSNKDTLLYNSGSGAWFARQINTGDVSGISNFVAKSETGVFYPASNPSGFITGLNQVSFLTLLPTGIEETGVLFPYTFSSIPIIFSDLIQVSDTGYLVGIKNTSVSGYTAIFSDVIQETGIYLQTLATTS